MKLKCKRWDCGKFFELKINKHQVYCSKDCAPYGNLKDPIADDEEEEERES